MKNYPLSVAIIDDYSPYSFSLIQEGLRYQKIKVIFYGPKRALKNKFYPKNNYQDINTHRIWDSLFFPLQIQKQTKGDHPDIIHVQHEINTFGSMATNLSFIFLLLTLKIRKIPTVVTEHAVLSDKELFKKKTDYLQRTAAKFSFFIFYKTLGFLSNKIIVHDGEFKKRLESMYGVEGKKISVIPHGVSVKHDSLVNSKNGYDAIFAGKQAILYFGFLSPRKGVEYLLQAFKSVKDANKDCLLVVAGDCPVQFSEYKKSLEALRSEYSLQQNVVFTGFIPDEMAAYLFSKVSLLVLPYTFSSSASGPLSIAMQNGIPVVATKTAYFESVLKDNQDALLVPPCDSDSLAKAINTLLNDKSLRERFSENIRKKALDLSWEKVAKMTADLYYE